MNRRKYVEDLKKQSEIVWDIIVIGGGATGLGVAHDASGGYITVPVHLANCTNCFKTHIALEKGEKQ